MTEDLPTVIAQAPHTATEDLPTVIAAARLTETEDLQAHHTVTEDLPTVIAAARLTETEDLLTVIAEAVATTVARGTDSTDAPTDVSRRETTFSSTRRTRLESIRCSAKRLR